jgi:sporulation protein YlmC with PRC-barrel domain
VKNFTVAILTATLALPLVPGAAAQMRQAPSTQPSRETWQYPQGAVESGELIGARVKNAEGKDLGEIDSVLVNERDGKVTHVIVGRGGLAGIGETKVVVPWSEVKLRRDRNGGTPVVSLDESVLDRAPRYERRRATGDQTAPPAASPGTAPSGSPREQKNKQQQ